MMIEETEAATMIDDDINLTILTFFTMYGITLFTMYFHFIYNVQKHFLHNVNVEHKSM